LIPLLKRLLLWVLRTASSRWKYSFFRLKRGAKKNFFLPPGVFFPICPDLCFPRRKLPIRKGGKTTLKEVPLYGGYLFYRCEELDSESISLIKSIPGFWQISPLTGPNPPPAKRRETFYSYSTVSGDIIGLSQVSFDINGRISVKEGPLKGMKEK
jgi:hypothetical protein